jgi:hypothetical protein
MDAPDPIGFLEDGLSPITRKERRNLLLSSAIGIAIVAMGIAPNSLTALGVTTSVSRPTAFKPVVGVVVLYFVLAFAIYGYADFIAWFHKRRHIKKRLIREEISNARSRERVLEELERIGVPDCMDDEDWETNEDFVKRHVGEKTSYEFMSSVATFRMLFDVALPLLAGLAIGIYLIATWWMH